MTFGATTQQLNGHRDYFSETLDPNYKKAIFNFEKAYRKLGISNTPEVHCAFVHVIEFCEKSMALGLFSEQGSESVHHDFATVWARCLRSQSHLQFGDQLLKAILKYSSIHLW